MLSRRWLLPVISWTGSALRMSLAVVISVYMAEAGTLDAFDSKHGWTVIFTIVVHASVDILNTSALLSTLSARKKGFKRYFQNQDDQDLLYHHTDAFNSKHIPGNREDHDVYCG